MTTTIPFPAPPTLEQAARKYWQLRRYASEGVVDSRALVTSLATLAKDHPRLAPLCQPEPPRHPERSEGSHGQSRQSTPVATGD